MLLSQKITRFVFLLFLTLTFALKTATAAPLKIDLTVIKNFGDQTLHTLLGGPAKTLGIYFQDGVSGTDMSTVGDLAQFVYLAELPKPLAGHSKVGLRIMLDGTLEVSLVDIEASSDGSIKALNFFSLKTCTIVLNENAWQAQTLSIAKKISEETPFGVRATPLEDLGVITVRSDGIEGMFAALKTAERHAESIDFIEMAEENYLRPFAFDTPKYLGDGTTSKIIDVDSLRTISAAMKKAGKDWHHGESKLDCELYLLN